MTDTTRMLDDTADRLLLRRLADPVARAQTDLRSGLLAEINEAGLTLALVPEEAEGFGGTLQDAAVIAWRWGWHAAPLPVVPLLLLNLLPGAGEDATLAEPAGVLWDGERLTGGRIEAPQMGDTARILVPCTGPGGDLIAEVQATGAERFHTLDHEPWLRLTANTAQVIAVHQATLTPSALAERGALLTAAAMAGAMSRVIEIVIDHANTRKQFGKPLGRFQAIQFLIAEATSEAQVARAALSGAISAEVAGIQRPLRWQAAKVQAARAATIVTAAAHQVMGAIGFTEEHVLHHYSKRLWVWRDDWGRQSALEAEIGRAACADPRGLWPHLVDDPA